MVLCLIVDCSFWLTGRLIQRQNNPDVARLLRGSWSVHVQTLSYGHEVWVVTERKRLWIQPIKMRFLSSGFQVESMEFEYPVGAWGKAVAPSCGGSWEHCKNTSWAASIGGLPNTCSWYRCLIPNVKPRTYWRDRVSHLAWDHLPEELNNVACKSNVLPLC